MPKLRLRSSAGWISFEIAGTSRYDSLNLPSRVTPQSGEILLSFLIFIELRNIQEANSTTQTSTVALQFLTTVFLVVALNAAFKFQMSSAESHIGGP